MSSTYTDEQLQDFEAFWMHFLKGHQHPGTRWAHVAALAVGALSIHRAIKKRSVMPLLVGAPVAAGLAVFAHPIFEGNWPENTSGPPAFVARAFLRLCARTVSGRVQADLAALAASSEFN